jgi:hypothetical protein
LIDAILRLSDERLADHTGDHAPDSGRTSLRNAPHGTVALGPASSGHGQ